MRRPRPPPQAAEPETLPPERQIFSANLVRLRQERGWTQVQLAEVSGVSQPHLSQLEQGNWEPRLGTITALAKAFGVNPSDLLPTLKDL